MHKQLQSDFAPPLCVFDHLHEERNFADWIKLSLADSYCEIVLKTPRSADLISSDLLVLCAAPCNRCWHCKSMDSLHSADVHTQPEALSCLTT